MEEIMSCRRLTDALADYTAATLATAEREVCEAHLARCRTCVEYLRAYRATIRVIKEAGAPSNERTAAMPEELVATILAATTRRSR
jgi:hypothetical protein